MVDSIQGFTTIYKRYADEVCSRDQRETLDLANGFTCAIPWSVRHTMPRGNRSKQAAAFRGINANAYFQGRIGRETLRRTERHVDCDSASRSNQRSAAGFETLNRYGMDGCES